MTIPEFIAAEKMTRERFAEIVGVSRSTVYRWLGSKNEAPVPPTGRELQAIHAATDGKVTANDVLGTHEAAPADAPAPALAVGG